MTAIHETAYPRIRSRLNARELAELYTPTPEELALSERHTKSPIARLGFIVTMKSFQRLGYCPAIGTVPPALIRHIAILVQLENVADRLQEYEKRQFHWKHAPVIRAYLDIRAFGDGGSRVMTEALTAAAQSKDIIADIVNAGIETLVRERYELPAFDTLVRAAKQARTRENSTYYRQVLHALSAPQKAAVSRLLTREDGSAKSSWDTLKRDPGQPTVKRIREYAEHLCWLQSLHGTSETLNTLPETKLQRFAEEARALNVSRMNEMQEPKRFTLAAALIKTQTAQATDDLTEMFIRRISKLHWLASEALQAYRLKNQEQTETLVALLGKIVGGWQAGATPEQRFRAVDGLIGGNAQSILEQCEAYLGYAGNNYLPFLPKLFKSHRKVCFDILELLRPVSTTEDRSLEEAVAFLRRNREARGERLPVTWTEAAADGRKTQVSLSLSWIPRRWWEAVTGIPVREIPLQSVDRKYFELCIFSCVMQELKSGDLCIPGAERFGDYRDQLISWQEYEAKAETYCRQVGISSDPAAFVANAKAWLTDTIRSVDGAFPQNEAVTIVSGEPVVRKVAKLSVPEGFALIDRLLAERLPECNIVDILTDTEHWLGWTKPFGPLSGHNAKIEDPRARYVVTAFCYGCNLGPTQTARCLGGLGRRDTAYLNQCHVTEERLLDAGTRIINAYNRFALPKLWGSGKSASADGTKWDVYEQNLLSEYHIRYGGWGGIGYYHVSDTYIALFSSFISCGVWEAVYILDGLLKNRSDIRPDVLHADTQGQSEAVFGLANLLGIKLMPRIRNWRELKFYLPDDKLPVKHLGDLFSETINGELIKTHLPDMLRIALSISEGKVHSSTILRKLGTYNRKNKLYQAFAELGRLVRTAFLLNFIGDAELRHTVTTATNTSEAWNGFIKWIAFGGDGVIRQNNREEQRKFIRYNHLVGNLIVFHNTVSMTRALQQLIDEGHPVTKEIIARFSPYKTQHINRFGSYEMHFDRPPPPVDEDLGISLA